MSFRLLAFKVATVFALITTVVLLCCTLQGSAFAQYAPVNVQIDGNPDTPLPSDKNLFASETATPAATPTRGGVVTPP